MMCIRYISCVIILTCLIALNNRAVGNTHVREVPDTLQQIVQIDRENFEPDKHGDQKVLLSFHRLGFLEAVIDSLVETDYQFQFYINTGPLYQYIILDHDLAPGIIGSLQTAFLLQKGNLSFEEFERLTRNILQYFQNRGYPFARIKPELQLIKNHTLHISLLTDLQELIVFDTLQTGQKVNLSNRFLEMHLGIRPGMPYDESRVQQIHERMSELDFVEPAQEITLSFRPGKAIIHMPLESKKPNRFDGIAGFSSTGINDEKPRITGLLNLYLSNTLGEGETFELNWQAPGQGSQLLNISGSYPYIGRLPLGSEVFFGLQRRDTTWLQLQFRPVLLARTESGTQWGVFMHYTQGSLISTRQYQSGQIAPASLDFSSRLYGIELRSLTSAYQSILMRPGYQLRASAAAGNRTIKQNSNLPSELYDDIETRRLQLNGEAIWEIRRSIHQRGTLSWGSRMAWLNGKDLPDNQLYRLGGFRTLKGFDELSLAASAYALAWTEYRLFVAENSFFSLLANGGWLERNQRTDYYADRVLGLAAGMNMETRAGIFALYVALGTQKNIPPQFRNAKIHVGYVSSF